MDFYEAQEKERKLANFQEAQEVEQWLRQLVRAWICFFFRGRCLVVATIRRSSSGILLVVWRWLWVKFGSLNFSTGMIQLTLAEHEPELDGLVTLKERNRQIVFKVNHELKQKNAWCHGLLY